MRITYPLRSYDVPGVIQTLYTLTFTETLYYHFHFRNNKTDMLKTDNPGFSLSRALQSPNSISNGWTQPEAICQGFPGNAV